MNAFLFLFYLNREEREDCRTCLGLTIHKHLLV
jgi:hypothetical protein